MDSIRLIKFLLVCLILVLAVFSKTASAIVIRDDQPEESYLAKELDYPYVVPLLGKRAVGTLIDPCWILTAGHVADFIQGDLAKNGEVIIGEVRSTISEVVFHPTWDIEEVGSPGVIDAALIKLSSCVEIDIFPKIYENQNEVGKLFLSRGGEEPEQD